MPRKPTETVALTLRIREDLRRKLERMAERNERSLNAEMAARLESSFDREDEDARAARIAQLAVRQTLSDLTFGEDRQKRAQKLPLEQARSERLQQARTRLRQILRAAEGADAKVLDLVRSVLDALEQEEQQLGRHASASEEAPVSLADMGLPSPARVAQVDEEATREALRKIAEATGIAPPSPRPPKTKRTGTTGED